MTILMQVRQMSAISNEYSRKPYQSALFYVRDHQLALAPVRRVQGSPERSFPISPSSISQENKLGFRNYVTLSYGLYVSSSWGSAFWGNCEPVVSTSAALSLPSFLPLPTIEKGPPRVQHILPPGCAGRGTGALWGLEHLLPRVMCLQPKAISFCHWGYVGGCGVSNVSPKPRTKLLNSPRNMRLSGLIICHLSG